MEVAIFQKVDFTPGKHYIILNGLILPKDRVFNMHVPDNRASTYMRQKLIEVQGEIDDCYYIQRLQHLLEMDKFGRQKITKVIVEIHNTMSLLSLMSVCRLLHSALSIHILFNSTWNFHQDRHWHKTVKSPICSPKGLFIFLKSHLFFYKYPFFFAVFFYFLNSVH